MVNDGKRWLTKSCPGNYQPDPTKRVSKRKLIQPPFGRAKLLVSGSTNLQLTICLFSQIPLIDTAQTHIQIHHLWVRGISSVLVSQVTGSKAWTQNRSTFLTQHVTMLTIMGYHWLMVTYSPAIVGILMVGLITKDCQHLSTHHTIMAQHHGDQAALFTARSPGHSTLEASREESQSAPWWTRWLKD